MTEKISVLVKKISNQLEPRYENHVVAAQHAWWMLQAITKKNQVTLVAEQDITLTQEQEKQLADWTHKQVVEHMPLQYLIGSTPFANLEIQVKPPIHIPRTETEYWCMELIAQLHTLPPEKLNILELCTGSGNIALALAAALPHARVTATDISDAALALAHSNAQHNNVPNVQFIHSDIYNAVPTDKPFDLIVANPPYIAPAEWATLDTSVTNWEDKRALVAADDGLAIIKKIITGAQQLLKPNNAMQEKKIPQLMIEIGYTQATAVAALMQDAGFVNVTTLQDLAGKDRVVAGMLST